MSDVLSDLMTSRALYEAHDMRLDGHLAAIISTHREAGLSWEAIAKRLYGEHGIDVSAPTVKRWATERIA